MTSMCSPTAARATPCESQGRGPGAAASRRVGPRAGQASLVVDGAIAGTLDIPRMAYDRDDDLGRVLINPVLQTAANVRFAPKATEMVHCREFPVRYLLPITLA
jgi:hypothetical protein